MWGKCVLVSKSTQSFLPKWGGDSYRWISSPPRRTQVWKQIKETIKLADINEHGFISQFYECLFLWNVRLSLPQTIGGVFIERLADYLLVKSVFGFSLAWDGSSGVYLKMSEEHQGAPCGLCGNFNHIPGDDLTTARGKVGPTSPCSSLPQSLLLYSQHWFFPVIVAKEPTETKVER